MVSAQFRADSSGFWWQVKNQLYYATIPTGAGWVQGGGIYPLPAAAGIVARDSAQGLTVLLAHDQHAPIPGAPAWLDLPESTSVLLGDAWGEHSQVLAREAGQVADLTISPGGASSSIA